MRAPPDAARWLKAFLEAGYCGVTIFFTLSGFVLAYNYFAVLGDRFDLRTLWSYLVARVARVYPLYLLILMWVAAPALMADLPTPHLLDHLLAIQAWDPDLAVAYAFNGPGWSVGVELFLYGCFPLLVLVLRPIGRSPLRILIAGFVTLAALAAVTLWFVRSGRGDLPWHAPQSAHRWLYRTPLSRLGDFTLGILTALMVPHLVGRRYAPALGSAFIFTGVLSIVALMIWPAHSHSTPSWDLSFALPSVLVILGLSLAPAGLTARLLGAPTAVLLGEASYAFYLCHAPLLQRLALAHPGGHSWWLANGMTAFMITAASVGLHVLVEKPALTRLRLWLDPRRRGTSRAPAVRRTQETGG